MQQIPIELIDRPSRPRKINPTAIAALKDSLTQAGQISPIVVIPDRIMRGILRDGYRLIVGNHRLSAAIELGWTEIKAEVLPVGFNPVHLELIEVDENLCRAELTASEKAAALKKRKILWESLREQNLGGNQVPTQVATEHKDRPQNQPGFAAATAEITGMSKRAINGYIKAADALGEDLGLVQGTPFDTKRGLARLSAMPREERLQVLPDSAGPTTIQPGLHRNCGAQDRSCGDFGTQTQTSEEQPKQPNATPTADPTGKHSIHRQVEAMIRRFQRLDPEVQRVFYETLLMTYQRKAA